MTFEIGLVLALALIAMALFSLERVPVDVVALGLLVALLVAGVLDPKAALAGFASDAVIVIAGLFVLTAGLKASGIVEWFGTLIERVARGRRGRSHAVLLGMVAAVSAFMNNTTTTATLMPVGIGIARANREPPSRILMPLAFASILGGSITLIGTSTNVIVSGLLPRYHQPPLGLFELAPVALPVAVLGVVYLLIAAPRLLPERADAPLAETYSLLDYLTEVEVGADSPLVGHTVAEEGFGKKWDLQLLRIMRRGDALEPTPDEVLEAGDLLLVEGNLDNLLRVGQGQGLAIRRQGGGGTAPLAVEGEMLIEAVVLPRSELVGRTLRDASFRQRYGATVIALNRHAEPVVEKIGLIPIGVGDVLLIQGGREATARLQAQPGLLFLRDRPVVRRERRALVAPLTFAVAIVLGGSGVLALPTAVLAGCFVLLATRTLSTQEAYRSIDWSILVLIAAMIGYGQAMDTTGAASFIADHLLAVSAGWGPTAVVAAFYLLTVALTQPMSNQAAALVVLPVAVEVALSAGLNPRAMAVTVALAASNSFLTPLEPSCLLVYGPGRYRFLDFPRLGFGLTVLAFVVTVVLVPRVWPL